MSQSYYGGEENPYEAIKVIEAWDLNFSLGSVLKYINRHGKKPGEDAVKDLKKCLDYIGYEIARLEREEENAPSPTEEYHPRGDVYASTERAWDQPASKIHAGTRRAGF